MIGALERAARVEAVAAVALGALFVAGCVGEPVPPPSDVTGGLAPEAEPESEAETPAPDAWIGLWRVVELPGAALVPDNAPLIELTADGLSGTTGCNRLFGDATFEDGRIELGPLGMTRRACAGAVGEQERRFVELLQAAERYELVGSPPRLHLTGARGAELWFERAES